MAKGKNNGKKNKNANLKAAYQTKREIWGVVIIALVQIRENLFKRRRAALFDQLVITPFRAFLG